MNWVIYSLLMFVASNLLYLIIRLLKKYSIDAELINLSLFAIPLILSFVLAIVTKTPLSTDLSQLILLLIAGIFLSYFGNKFSLKGITESSNPGFSLMIQKSYASFTIIVSFLLFQSELSIQKVLGSLIILIGIFLTGSENKINLKEVIKTKWFRYSLVAYFLFGLLSLLSKYLFASGLSALTYLFYISLIVSTISLFRAKNKVKILKPSRSSELLIICGVLSFLFNIFGNLAVSTAPNIGYVNATNAASIASLTILSSLIFKDSLNKNKLAGIWIVLLGLIAIFML